MQPRFSRKAATCGEWPCGLVSEYLEARFLRWPGGLTLCNPTFSCPVSVQLFPVIQSLSHWAESPEQAGPCEAQRAVWGRERTVSRGLDPWGLQLPLCLKAFLGLLTLISKA